MITLRECEKKVNNKIKRKKGEKFHNEVRREGRKKNERAE